MRRIFLSINTTGQDLSCDHRVIEIGCKEVVNGTSTENDFHYYLNPDREVDESSIAEHGIVNEFLEDKPFFSEVALTFLEYVKDSELVVYDEAHTIGFIKKELDLTTRSLSWTKTKDLLKLAEKRHPEQKNTLRNLYKRYYIDSSKDDYENALVSCGLNIKLLESLENEKTKSITSNLNNYELGDNLTVVKSFAELDHALEGISKTALCRGVSNHEYPLLPSLFRHTDVESADIRETNLMWVFKTHSRAHLTRIPSSEIEWLTIAQHHGLPTRLLDWSLSPLIACFFAVQSRSSSDSAIYIYDVKKFKKEEDISTNGLKEITAFFPPHATKRVTAQSGMFTIHPTKKMKLESDTIKKIVIPAEKKVYFMEKLVKYGIHHATTFPDLDGLSGYIRFQNDYK